MSYALYIERHVEDPVTGAEWRNAVAQSDGFRLQKVGVLTVSNPQTGENISRPLHAYDAEYLDPETGHWHVVLFWLPEGRVRTQATRGFDNPRDPFRIAPLGLAQSLGASVLGQEGELYA